MWCVIFAGVPVAPTPGLRRRLAGHDRVVAADGGARTALAFGLTPDLLVGDLDSLDPALLADPRLGAVPVQRHPTDKEATDGELALAQALAWGATTITIVGALGGERLDHGLGNLLLLARPELIGRRVALLTERGQVELARGGERLDWAATPGEVVSLLPLSGAAEGVTTRGLRWPLDGARLPLGTTRGISNQAVAPLVGVSLTAGLLLVTRALAPDLADWPGGPAA